MGKSYILLEVKDFIRMCYPKDQVIFIDKKLEYYTDLTNHNERLKYITNQSERKKKRIFLFADEIQEIKNLEFALGALMSRGIYDIWNRREEILAGRRTWNKFEPGRTCVVPEMSQTLPSEDLNNLQKNCYVKINVFDFFGK